MGRAPNNTSSFKASSASTRLRYLFLLATVIGPGFLILCLNNNIEIFLINKKVDQSTWNDDEFTIESIDDRFAIDTKGCSIPALQPLDEAIKEYVGYPKEIKPCRNSTFDLLDSNRTHIWIKRVTEHRLNVTSRDKLSCCYKPFTRPDSIVNIASVKVDNRVQYNKCVQFSKEIKVSDEFVKVECFKNRKQIYQQFFLFTLKKSFSSHGVKEINESKPAYNILVMGIDGVSRLNFHRTMPKTLQFLKNKGAVELLGYNKVGDNTFPNVVPMLLGVKETELRKTCLPYSWSTFDNCPFVWDWFKQSGYYTAFAEDSSSLGTFNYQRSGFASTPTDYYPHTFINEAERNVGNNKDFNSFLCMNGKYFFDVLLRYIEDLTTTLKSNKLFGFFWEVTMSHDYLNYPMLMDNSYEYFLKTMDVANYLDATILLLVSDHGLRWGKMRSTKQGRLEERLPFVHVLVPQSFRFEYSEAYNNLKLNSRRLTTPFDIHATLYDLVDLDNIKNEQILSRIQSPYGQSRSISLFLPIVKNRTCQMADIDDHWCTCQRSNKLSLTSVESLTAAYQLLRHLNQLLHDYRQCATLKMSDIIEVSEVKVGTPERGEVGWREYIIVIRTQPGGGLFEATLRHDAHDWFLAGTVSRLNLYGNQSRCMYNYQLKLYCFCI